MVRKNIFMFLISWEKINKSIKKRKSQKVKEISKMGSGGAEVSVWCKKKMWNRPSPKDLLQPPACLKQEQSARFPLSSIDPDSLTFIKNLQQQTCKASCHDSKHVKKSI